MLSEFVRENRGEIIERCRVRVAARMAPRPTESELEHGIPLFLDQLTATLHSKLVVSGEPGASAVIHGKSMLRRGFTIGQVVQDYGDVCQTITEIALEQTATITVDEFRTLNMCLDEAIASAVGEFGRQQAIDVAASGAERATKDLGFLAHELRNLIATATLAFDALWNGSGAITGSTGAVLGRTLKSLGHLVDRSLAVVRLDAGVLSRETIVIGDLIQEIEVTATLEAKVRLHQLTIEVDDASAVVEGDRQDRKSVV